VTELSLDPRQSRVRVQTFAEGLFARLAHDIEIDFGSLSGRASRDDKRATIEAPLAGARVAGVLHKDRVDEDALSASDRDDILDKMRRDVFHANASDRVAIEATVDGGSANVTLTPPKGRAITITIRPEITDEGQGIRARGSFDLSLSAIGSDVVKGPMNAFRVKDRVAVTFDLVFQPA
jgi:hypothetical protein